jgi:hypothetical protein
MDPQAAWDKLLEAYAEKDWDQVTDLATGLLAWLDRGGFPPRAVAGVELGQDFDRAISRFGCAYAIAVATKETLSELNNDEGN